MSNAINYSLDTTKSDYNNPTYKLRQGDGNYQKIRATITSNGEPMDLTDVEVSFNGTNSAGYKVIDYAIEKIDARNGLIEYTPNKQMGANVGKYKEAYFRFVSKDKTATSASFSVDVLTAVDLTELEAKNYVSVIDVMVETAKEKTEKTLSDNTKAIVAQLASAKDKLDKQLSDGQAKADKQLADNKSELDKQLSESKSEIEQRLTDSKNEIDATLADSKSKIDTQVKNGKQAIDDQVATSKTKIDGQLDDLKQKIAMSISDFTSKVSSAQSAVTNAKYEIDNKLTEYSNRLDTKFNDTQENVNKLQTALDAMKSDSSASAKLSEKNTFTNSNTFSSGLTVKGLSDLDRVWTMYMKTYGNHDVTRDMNIGGNLNVSGTINGNATNAKNADKATQADKATTSETSDSSKTALSLEKEKTYNVASIIQSDLKTATVTSYMGSKLRLSRMGNVVTLILDGKCDFTVNAWSEFGPRVPVGYRPNNQDVIGVVRKGSAMSTFNVNPQGMLWNHYVQWNKDKENDYWYASVTYTTSDDMPN